MKKKVVPEVQVSSTITVPPAPSPTPVVPLPIQKVQVASSEPPPFPLRRAADREWWWWMPALVRFFGAPLVEHWRGLSLNRFLAIGTFLATVHLAHDWLKVVSVSQDAAAKAKIIASISVGWAFDGFVLGGFFLAILMALGAKYIDKLLAIIAAKLGVALVNTPTPPLLTERHDAN